MEVEVKSFASVSNLTVVDLKRSLGRRTCVVEMDYIVS